MTDKWYKDHPDFDPIDMDAPEYKGLNLDRGFHGTAQFEMSNLNPVGRL